jgi:hypothetical protein
VKGLDDPLRAQLFEGLPARVQGMAEELVSEWETAVEAVPALARAASAEVVALLRLDATEREQRLRTLWARRHPDGGTDTDLAGTPRPLRVPADDRVSVTLS